MNTLTTTRSHFSALSIDRKTRFVVIEVFKLVFLDGIKRTSFLSSTSIYSLFYIKAVTLSCSESLCSYSKVRRFDLILPFFPALTWGF